MEKNPLEFQLLYQQKPDNNYFANTKKARYVQNIFFVSWKCEPLTPLLTSVQRHPTVFCSNT